MTEGDLYRDMRIGPEREEKLKVLKAEIGVFFGKERDEGQKRNLINAVKYLAKHFEYIAEEKVLRSELFKKNKNRVQLSIADLHKKISTHEDDTSHIRLNNPGFKEEYDFLFTKAHRLTELFSVNPQAKATGIAESKTAKFLKTYI